MGLASLLYHDQSHPLSGGLKGTTPISDFDTPQKPFKQNDTSGSSAQARGGSGSGAARTPRGECGRRKEQTTSDAELRGSVGVGFHVGFLGWVLGFRGFGVGRGWFLRTFCANEPFLETENQRVGRSEVGHEIQA